MSKILVTGAAGFIGFHLSRYLCAQGHEVIGLDSVNDYYDPRLKEARLKELAALPAFTFYRQNLTDKAALAKLFERETPQYVAHLAAQAGVRYSLENPQAYIDSNIVGFTNILEACRYAQIKHLVFASSSSVYGANTKMPFSVSHNVDHPVSLYAASKKSNELMAHSYAHLFNLPCTGLRYFTVYGPWGRPDMALFKFTKAIFEGQPIDVYNEGNMRRDFTYIDDIVEGTARTLFNVATPNLAWKSDAPDPASSAAPYRLYNIGNNTPIALLDMIKTLEEATGIEAQKNMMPMQPGDVKETYADIDALSDAVGFKPDTPLKDGIIAFVDWYKSYYEITA